MSSRLALELDRAQSLDDGDDEALFASLRPAFRRALRAGEAAAWFARVACLIERGRPELGLRLIRHALASLRGASTASLAEHAARLHLAACALLQPDALALAAELLELERGHDAFARSEQRYAALLGKAGRDAFRRLAGIAWAQVQPSTPDRRAADATDPGRARLAAILERLAATDGDFDTRIAVRAKTLATRADYQAIVALCRAHGREAEAKRWAEEAEWQFPTRRENARTPAAAARGRR